MHHEEATNSKELPRKTTNSAAPGSGKFRLVVTVSRLESLGIQVILRYLREFGGNWWYGAHVVSARLVTLLATRLRLHNANFNIELSPSMDGSSS